MARSSVTETSPWIDGAEALVPAATSLTFAADAAAVSASPTRPHVAPLRLFWPNAKHSHDTSHFRFDVDSDHQVILVPRQRLRQARFRVALRPISEQPMRLPDVRFRMPNVARPKIRMSRRPDFEAGMTPSDQIAKDRVKFIE
jgi:hypothetical protein